MVRQKCSGIRRSYLELIGNAKKVTITWHKFSPFKTRAPSYMSKRVSAMKNGSMVTPVFATPILTTSWLA